MSLPLEVHLDLEMRIGEEERTQVGVRQRSLRLYRSPALQRREETSPRGYQSVAVCWTRTSVDVRADLHSSD